MKMVFGFGEAVAGYDVPVLNEREVRAAAGILFVFALVSFMNSWLMGNFRLTRDFRDRLPDRLHDPDLCRSEVRTEHDSRTLRGAQAGA